MRFKNALRLLFPNFGTVYKSLTYRLIIFVFGLALTAALILPNLMFILESAELAAVFASFSDLFHSLMGRASAEGAASVSQAMDDLFALIGSHMGNIVWSVVWACVIWLVCSFLNGLANYTLGKLVNNHMASMSHNGFTTTLVGNLKQACLYQLVYMGVTVPFFVLLVAAAYFIGVGLLGVLSVFSFMLAFLVVAALVALEQAFVSMLLPALIAGGMRFREAFRFAFRRGRKEFTRTYLGYFSAVYVIVVVNAAAAVFTLLTGLLFSVPLTYLFLVNLQFVNFYTLSGRKYYIDYDNIVVPKQLRKEEKLLDEIDI